MCNNGSTAAVVLPEQPGTILTNDQVKIERDSISKYERAARGYLFAALGLLASTTVVHGFIEPPYLWRTLLWVGLILSVVSSGLAAYAVLIARSYENALDLYGKKLDRTKLNGMESSALYLFFAAFLAIVTFTGANLFETFRFDRGAVDIQASSFVVGPGEVVLLNAEGVDGEGYRWAADVGTLLDDNEKSVAWVAPDLTDDLQTYANVEVCARTNHLFICETSRILLRNQPLASRASFFQPISDARPWRSEEISQEEIITKPLDPVPPISDISCCSTVSPFLRWDCKRYCRK
tara:strand:+ start:263 stop:1141 length:879 start_codon:yes stop_codon:yes gene_type:complete